MALEGRWHKITQSEDDANYPGARSSHSVVGVGAAAYVFGGEFEPRTPISNETYKYHHDRRAFERLELPGAKPEARVGHNAAAAGHEIIMFGGRVGVSIQQDALGDVWAFDTRTNEWQLRESAAPAARSYHAMTSVGDEYVAVFGGCGTEGRLNDLHLYHAPTNRWVEIKAANAPSVRGGAALACTRSNTLVLFGGFDGSELGDLHLLALPAELAQVFDGATTSAATALAWEAVSTVAAGGTRAPGPRSVAGMCAIGGERVVLFGGELDASPDGHAGAGHFTAESFVFDAAQRTWSSATTQSYHHDAASGTEADDGEGPCARGWLTIAPVARPRDDADVLAADVLAADVLVVGGLHASNRRLSDAFVLELRGV